MDKAKQGKKESMMDEQFMNKTGAQHGIVLQEMAMISKIKNLRDRAEMET